MAKKKNDPPADYAVGRGKPPRDSQFKPGQSGNPGGRKTGCRNLKTILRAVAENEIELTEHGQKRVVSLVEALLLRQAQDGLRGNGRATDSLLDRIERLRAFEGEDSVELPEEDEEIVRERLLRSRRSKTATRPCTPVQIPNRDDTLSETESEGEPDDD
jgi:hypothetical protein